MGPKLSRSDALGLGGLGLAGFLGLWGALSFFGIVPVEFLPSPFAVGSRFIDLFAEPFAGFTLPQHLGSSLLRYLYGVLLAACIGIPLGLAMGWFHLLDDIVTPIFNGLRFIAPIAWVPFAALWFGTGIGGPILIIFAGAFPPCLINAYRGARFVEPRLVEAARMLGTNHGRMLTEILLPASVPSIVAGLRVAAGLGWQSLVGAELIVASAGVGFMMVQAQASVQTTTVMAGMVAIGLTGLAIDVALRQGERWLHNRLGLD
ncbi:MAG: ABC transporter permease [Hyphomicrobiales bacterium]|nr:ABC transporter permease [Hyphomicrobiales bacterium]